MNTKAVIIEQLEWSGHLKSFTLQAQRKLGQMCVAFPTRFSDSDYGNKFEQKRAKCRTVKLPTDKFYMQGKSCYFSTMWNHIPTQEHELTFYILSFPEYAIPDEIIISDTYISDKFFNKTVYRDDKKKRYVVYLECWSRRGFFNFQLTSKFHKDAENFSKTQYRDNQTVGFFERSFDRDYHWHYLLPEEEVKKVSNFFAEQSCKPIEISKRNNSWISGSFYLFLKLITETYKRLSLFKVKKNGVQSTTA